MDGLFPRIAGAPLAGRVFRRGNANPSNFIDCLAHVNSLLSLSASVPQRALSLDCIAENFYVSRLLTRRATGELCN
jgi:hypothetical protein